MELSDLSQLPHLVVNLTTNGTRGFDESNLKRLKSMCKHSNFVLEEAFRLMYSQLEKEHAEIRLAAVLLIDEFFHRSHLFRTLLLERFAEFLEFAAGTNFDKLLPEPKAIAQDLMKTTIKCVHKWHSKFGTVYKRLSLGYNFLIGAKKTRLIDADEVQKEIQKNAAEYVERKNEEQKKNTMKKLLAEISLDVEGIKVCLAELDACITLLVPKHTDDDSEVENLLLQTNLENKRASGIISHDFSIVLDVPQHVVKFVEIQRGNDNEIILENLHDRKMILKNSFLPKVKKWIQQLSLYDTESETLKHLLDVKEAIHNSLGKAKDLVVQSHGDIPSTSKFQTVYVSSDCDSSDGEFVEVPEKVVISPHNAFLKAAEDTLVSTDHRLGDLDVSIWKPIRDYGSLDDPVSHSRDFAVQNKLVQATRAYGCDPVKLHPREHANGQPVNLWLNRRGH